MRRLDLALPVGDDVVRFDVERVTIEPFDLRQPCRYDLVLDRLTHWYHTSREWIKKAVVMDGLYVFNNPWAVQAMEKHTTLLRDDGARHADPRDVDGAAEGVRADAPTSTRRWSATRSCSTSAQVGDRTRLPDVHEAVRRRRLGAASAGSTTRPALRDGLRGERQAT